MKRYSVLLLATVFAAVLFTGCGCRNSKPAETSMPTVPTTSTPATQATEPSTMDIMPSTDATIEDGNGPLPTNATAGADGNTDTENNDAGGGARSGRNGYGGANGSGSGGTAGMNSGSTGGSTGSTNGSQGNSHTQRVMPKN